MSVSRFNLRVYGLVFNPENTHVLIAKEKYHGRVFQKFPGGGLEFGEGLIQGLRREFNEELNCNIESASHFYTTDFFQQSAFRQEDQIISVYYEVQITQPIKQVQLRNDYLLNKKEEHGPLSFHWLAIAADHLNELSFPIDKVVFSMLINR